MKLFWLGISRVTCKYIVIDLIFQTCQEKFAYEMLKGQTTGCCELLGCIHTGVRITTAKRIRSFLSSTAHSFFQHGVLF